MAATNDNSSTASSSSTTSLHLSLRSSYMSDEKEVTNSAASTALSCPSERSLRVSCYCEENVWRLAYRKLHSTQKQNDENNHDDNTTEKEYHVVFISNKEKCCPMFHQLAKEEKSLEPCLWDYHVILLCTTTITKSKKYTIVLDMDSRAPYPCPLQEYLWLSFRKLEFIHENYREKYAPRFRVIKATEYLKYFYSDRMHMYNTKTKTWHAKPPTYDCIMNGLDFDKQRIKNQQQSSTTEAKDENLIEAEDEKYSNLDRYMDMAQGRKGGKLDDSSAINNDENNRNIKIGLSSDNNNCLGGGEGNEQVYGHVYTFEEFEEEFCS